MLENRKEKKTWHNIFAWGNLAKRLAKYVRKGERIQIDGRIDNRSYEVDGVTKIYIRSGRRKHDNVES